MLKISQAGKAGHSLTLKLEGSVIGPWVGELQLTCEALLNQGRMLNLNLNNVTYADAEGAKLLADLKSRGVTFESCSPFISELLKSQYMPVV
jgi:hypothetical protein